MPRGGKRKNAGRPDGKGPYGEATRIMRVPESMVAEIKQFAATKGFKVPLYSSRVQAGYPSSADEHVERQVDLAAHLISNPTETFLVHVTGESMIEAGIHEGDMLVVDRSLEAKHGRMVVAAVDGQVTVKYLHIRKGKAFLVPANKDFQEIPINDESGASILGVVTRSIKTL